MRRKRNRRSQWVKGKGNRRIIGEWLKIRKSERKGINKRIGIERKETTKW